MPAVAEVQFKATGSSEVEGAFKSIGSAAQDSSTKIGQNSSAMKSMGQGMKSSVSNIGAVTTAFATLAISVVSTWRAYRDLGDAQLGVDRANFKVQKSTQAVANAQRLVAGLKAGMKKTDLESVAATSKIIAREEALKKKLKDGSITRKAAKAEQDAINLARSKVGSDKAAELSKAEQDLKNKTEALGLAQESATQKQKHFNDSVQDFYLSLLPTAISVVATAVSGLESMKNIVGGGGGGLIGSLGGIGLVLGAGSLALLAYKNNWLGFRDAVGGVIDWIKERFGLWKDTIEKVFNFIKSGDWNGAFNMIKEAAVKFWQDLVKTVPFFGTVSDIIEKIKKGDWAGAFNIIATAAETAWATLVAKVPFFGGVATLIDQIKKGDWKGAFNTIGAAFQEALKMIGGEDLVLKIQRLRDTAYAEFNLMKNQLTGTGGPFDLIQQGLAKLGSGDIVGGFSQIWLGIDKAIGIAINRFNDWVKLNFGIDLNALATQALAIGNKILDGIKSGLTFVARTWIDPLLVALLDPQTWIQGFIAMGGFFVKIGTALYTAIGTALGNAAKDPKGTADWWSKLGGAIWDGITTWFEKNLPGAKKALEAMAQSFVDAFESTKVWFTNIGIGIWNNIIEGLKSAVPVDFNDAVKGWLESLKRKPVEVPAKIIIQGDASTQLGGKGGIPVFKAAIEPKLDPNTGQIIQKAIDQGGTKEKKYTVQAGFDSQKMPRELQIQLNKAIPKNTKIPVGSDLTKADQGVKTFVNKTNNTHATIKVGVVYTGASAGTSKGISAGAHFQHGYQSTVKRPTLFMAGEGGRPEDVVVRPRGSVQRGGSVGGGGFYGTVNVYVDGVLRPARYDMGARK